MYYSQQSPAVAHKVPDQSPWSRTHHPVLGPPGPAPSLGPPPASPGYALFTNGNVNHLQHHPTPHPHMPMQHHHHHHQNSLSHLPSPPHQHQQHPLGSQADSPGSIQSTSNMLTPHWQQQLLKCEMIRQSRSPHHRARASAMASRTVTKSAIPITNPNLPKPEPNGTSKEILSSSDLSRTGSSPVGSSKTPATSESSPNGLAADHPSSTAGPAEAPRPKAPKLSGNTWTSLDMGGVNIKSIPPNSGLFSFIFLINLYLNHNQLTAVPPQICKLRHLELLDLSGNQLRSIPPELGMLTSLKELYLFDNNLSAIPQELGTLHQLQTLGIEGNPVDPSLKAIVQKEGTPSLISVLRDTCPVPAPPPPRQWKNVISQVERESIISDSSIEVFSVLCYNVLCERCATERLYGYTPSWALTWDYRKELILAEILESDADFLCLQEVDNAQYEEFFLQQLGRQGYEGIYWPKSRAKTMNEADRRLVDGCATFYKADKYTLVEKQLIEFSTVAMQRPDFKKTDDMFNRVLGKDHIAVVCLFENKETGTRYIIVNVHLHWDPQYRDVKLVQTALLIDEIDKIAARFAKYPPRLPPAPASLSGASTNVNERSPPVYSDGYKIPLIICGDFNSVPESGVYEYLSTGSVVPNHADFMSHMYGKYTSEGLKHKLGMKSAYSLIGELPMTNHTPSFQGVIDYIWYSAANLGVNAVFGEVDKQYLEKVVGFPNAHFPSDHLCIVSEFRVKPPRDTPSRPHPSAAFSDSYRSHS